MYESKNTSEKVITVSTNAKEGHIPSALSILDILWVLYERILKVDPSNPRGPNRVFVLSKGQAAIGLYVVLAQKGFFPMSALDSFAKFNTHSADTLIKIKFLVLKHRQDHWDMDFL